MAPQIILGAVECLTIFGAILLLSGWRPASIKEKERGDDLLQKLLAVQRENGIVHQAYTNTKEALDRVLRLPINAVLNDQQFEAFAVRAEAKIEAKLGQVGATSGGYTWHPPAEFEKWAHEAAERIYEGEPEADPDAEVARIAGAIIEKFTRRIN
jgi:hypothetical protein